MSYHIYIPRDLEIQAGKKKLQYCFGREALLYDISNYCYVQGQVISEEIENARHMTIDVAQDGNIDRVTRVLNLAFDEVVELLYRITKDEVDDKSEYTNEFHVPESYHVTMNVHDKFSITTANLLQTLIHEYLVCRAVEDWISITYAHLKPEWTIKVEDLKKKIKTALTGATGKARIPKRPF
ncbi:MULTISPECIES: hypothetical protein [Porphyromonas]|uniref:hypothetical protein n=1 Tax=Porphyromonas TaxID=836 RepID=UPI00068EC83B|nr:MULTISPECIES: hypothetical protein [Porphyromonas]